MTFFDKNNSENSYHIHQDIELENQSSGISEISEKKFSDQDYNPETESESISTDEEYIVSSQEEASEEEYSDDSQSFNRKRKKKAKNIAFQIKKRPNFKFKSKSKKNISSCESSSTSNWEEDNESDIQESDQDIFIETIPDNRETIEKVIDSRKGKENDTGPETSIYNKLIGKYEEPKIDLTEDHFLIKWKGRSYIHCTWESHKSLINVKGIKKVENFIKRNELIHNDSNETELLISITEPIDEYKIIERILSYRLNPNDINTYEYLCKWNSLPYEDSTWECESIVKFLNPECIKKFSDHILKKITPFDSRRMNSIAYSKDKVFKKIDECNLSSKPELRDYQVEGVKWLIHSCFVGNSVILADEMGLGKTVQIIKYVDILNNLFNINGPHLIIVPLSTLDAWVKHFKIWAPLIYIVTFAGNITSRKIIKEYEFEDKETKNLKFNVMLTTYEWVFKESELFSSINWFSLVIDEGHRIKNENSMLHQLLYDFNSFHRILMTGTPLQNSLRELWSLLHFIMPHKFSQPDEIERYGSYEDPQKGYDELKCHISEFILRRTKKDVERSLPPKIEQILRVDMTNEQKKLYKWILTKNYSELARENHGNYSGFLNIIMELKKCCNHSQLVSHDYQNNDELNNLLSGSGKLILLDKLMMRLKISGNRVLIFSQMVSMLDILVRYLEIRGFGYQRLDGSMNEASRIRAIEHFNSPDSKDFCFILSTRAGGLGINLVTADTVIIYDSDWNPQNDLQAQARAHRIGQTKQVKIYRLVTKCSIEQDIIERAKRKMILDHLVIQTMDPRSGMSGGGSVMFNKEELSMILKFGAEELFKESISSNENGINEPLQELDLDEIMKLAEKQNEPLSKGEQFLSSFKVANFKAVGLDGFHEIPNWSDIIPPEEIAKIQHENLLKREAELHLPPRRKNRPLIETSINSGSDDNYIDEKDYFNIDLDMRTIKKFIRELRKFPLPFKRLDIILQNINLSENPNILQLSSHIQNNLLKGSRYLIINKIKFDLIEFINDLKITEIVGKIIEQFIKEHPNYSDDEIKLKFSLSCKFQKVSWNNKWTKNDDSHFFIGVYYHGLDNWQSFCSDSILKLNSKLKNSKGKIIQGKLLRNHIQYLTNHISKQDKKQQKIIPKSLNDSKDDNFNEKNLKNFKEKDMKKCVDILRSVKHHLEKLEGITIKQLSKNIIHIKKIGTIINSKQTKTLKVSSDTLWTFVSRFTNISPQQLKKFYLKNCIAK